MTESGKTLIDKWREEGREEGIEKGRIEDRQDSIIDILSTRFGAVPDSVCEAIRRIQNAQRLTNLTVAAVNCPSINQFAESLE